MLEWAASDAPRVGKVRDFARFLDAAESGVPVGGQLHPDAVVIDANTMVGIEQLLLGRPFASIEPNLQNAINAVRAANGRPPYVDPPGGARPSIPDIVGPGVDLRTTIAASAEILRGEAATRTSSGVLGGVERVNAARTHADYADVIADLNTAPQVGGPKGAADRSFIADALFADARAGARPRIVSADEDIVTRLAGRRFLTGPRAFTPTGSLPVWEQIRLRFPEGQFTITIRGHSMDVIFGVNRPGVAPVPP
jgi:hypothetical protein